jgi:hypothetical protein
VPDPVVRQTEQPDPGLLGHVLGHLLAEGTVHHSPGHDLVVEQVRNGIDHERFVHGGDGAVVDHRHLDRAHLEAFHGGTVVAELACRVDFHFEGALGCGFDVVLESQGRRLLGLVELGGLEVGILDHLGLCQHDARQHQRDQCQGQQQS